MWTRPFLKKNRVQWVAISIINYHTYLTKYNILYNQLLYICTSVTLWQFRLLHPVIYFIVLYHSYVSLLKSLRLIIDKLKYIHTLLIFFFSKVIISNYQRCLYVITASLILYQLVHNMHWFLIDFACQMSKYFQRKRRLLKRS